MKMHWGGGLRYPSRGRMVRVLSGWPVCASGDAAEKVVTLGLLTDDLDEVSCARCRRLLDRAAEAQR